MQTSEEGGVVAEEYRVAYVADRVATFGTAALALTLDCCRCHDHKYDPVTQKEYYGLFALFQNIDESGQTSYFTAATPTPALPLPTPADEATLAALARTAAVRREAALAEAVEAATGALPHAHTRPGRGRAALAVYVRRDRAGVRPRTAASSCSTGRSSRPRPGRPTWARRQGRPGCPN